MTISAVTESRVVYTGSGTLGPFSVAKGGVPITFSDNTHIKVRRYASAIATTGTLLTEDTDYTLTGGPASGQVTLISPAQGVLTSSERLEIERDVPISQNLDLINGANFSSTALENRLDRIIEAIADVDTRSRRTFSLHFTDGEAVQMPPAAERANKYLYFDESGNPTAYSGASYEADIAAVADYLDEIAIVADADADIATIADNIDAILAASAAGLTSVASHAAAVALDTSGYSNGQAIFIRGRTSQNDGGGGIWCWNTADLSSEVTADPEAARYLPPSSDDTGASGAFVKQTGGNTVFNVLEYGATGDGTTDDTDAVNAAIAAIPTTGNTPGGVLYFPRGHYRLDQIDDIPDYTTVMGDGPTSTRLDFQDQASGNGLSTAGTSYFVVFKDFLLQSAYAHGIHADNMSQGRFENVFVRWCGTDGIYIDNSSYQITLENVRTDSNDGMGLNIEGFVTSIFCQNVFARLNGSHGFRINDAVYTRLANCSSDQNTGNGYIASNVTCLTLAGCSAEKNTKSAIKFAASDAIAANCLNGASGEYGYVREVTIDTFFSFHNAQETGTTTASFIACDSDDSREIDVLLVNCRDEVDVGEYTDASYVPANSVDITGNTRMTTGFQCRFDKLTSVGAGCYYWDALNTRTVPKWGQQWGGVNWDTYINDVLVQRTSTAGTTFRGSTINSAFFNLLGTTDSAGAVGLAIKTSDSNANARDWGIVNGNWARGDLAFIRSTTAGGNPVSGGDVGLLIDQNRNVCVKTSTGYEALTVNGNICGVADNTKTCGTATFRWSTVYAGTGTINTSDEREKRDIEDPSDAEIRAISRVLGQIRKYRWKDAYEEKGDGARIHFGVIAQEVLAAFEAEGLDARRYALFCEDPMWEYERNVTDVVTMRDEEGNAVLDEDGNEITTEQFEMIQKPLLDDEGNQVTRMGVRYDQLMSLAMAAMWARLEA
jgi:hypothetical protein